MTNHITGSVLEFPHPDKSGRSALTLNGKVIDAVMFSDSNGGSVTLGDGRVLKAGREFAVYAMDLLEPSAE